MKKMIFTSQNGTKIEFDTYEDETKEYGIYWVDMCPECYKKYKGILKKISDNGSGVASCSVIGCKNTNASIYVDFTKEEVNFVE